MAIAVGEGFLTMQQSEGCGLRHVPHRGLIRVGIWTQHDQSSRTGGRGKETMGEFDFVENARYKTIRVVAFRCGMH